MNMSATGTLLSILHGASSLVGIGCEIVLLVIVAGAVRRHRPDAFKPLLAWAIAALVSAIVLPLVGTAVTLAASRAGGIEAVLSTQAVLTTFGIVVRIALTALLVRGLVRLAQPPKPVVVEGDAPYR